MYLIVSIVFLLLKNPNKLIKNWKKSRKLGKVLEKGSIAYCRLLEKNSIIDCKQDYW